MKKRVLLVSTKTTGGAARACLMQLKALSLSGNYDCHLLTLYGPENELPGVTELNPNFKYGLTIIQRVRNRLLQEIRKLFSNFISDGVHVPYGIYDISNEIVFKEADVVVFHWCYHFVDFSKLPRDSSKQFYWVCHDMSPFNGGIPYEMRGNVLILNIFKRLIEPRLKRQLNGLRIEFIFPSMWLRDLFKRSGLAQMYPSHILPYSSDFDEVVDESEHVTRLERSLCFIAADVTNPRKGFEILVGMLHLIQEPCIINVIGQFEEGKTELPHWHVFHFHGFLRSTRAIAQVFMKSKVFVMPSVEDNLPNTVIESLMCGTPVVGFRIGGIPEMVSHECLGILGEQTSPQILRECVEMAFQVDWNHEEVAKQSQKEFSHHKHSNQFGVICGAQVDSVLQIHG
jgi:glycosyltransferase involved in cell wall biosynthesis